MPESDMARPLLERDHGGSVGPWGPSSGGTVGILGTGDFARSLATCLLCSGFKVVVGSRNPKRNAGIFPAEAELMSQEEAVKRAELLFVALYKEHYCTLRSLAGPLAHKILIDVSNNQEVNTKGESNAEYLASLFPHSTVVKGFNVVSAWALQSGPKDGNKQVLLCSNCPEARSHVAGIARSLGFTPVDMGSLSSAREIENIPLRLLPFWKVPLVLALGLFLFFYLYNFVRAVLHPYLIENQNKFYKMPLELLNITLPCVSYVLLSLVYVPGVLAAFYQLRRGTKYRRFPHWLDQWLLHRKQIGLVSFFCACLHALYSLSLPMRRSARYLLISDAVKQVGEGGSGRRVGGGAGLAHGDLRIVWHHGARAALPIGRHLPALRLQLTQLERIHLHPVPAGPGGAARQHAAHTRLRMEPGLRRKVLQVLPAPHLHPHPGGAQRHYPGPSGPAPALRPPQADADPQGLGEEELRPDHDAQSHGGSAGKFQHPVRRRCPLPLWVQLSRIYCVYLSQGMGGPTHKPTGGLLPPVL
ncbi:metalloreductase STEAP3 isoform X2 [Xenopus tropicalis]|nr:metalloreductase STEAP3 isoform X2 [Xenopus tropicalis]